MDANTCNSIFDDSIRSYHKLDSVDQPLDIPHPENSFEALLYHKNWIDTVQWHLEDLIRDPANTGNQITALKRRIDKSNQDRTDMVERIDDVFIEEFQDIQTMENSRLNTETPAWAIDRLSILALKIFHMREQTMRNDVDTSHKNSCKAKLDILLEQRKDLSNSLDELLEDIKSGTRYMKVYRQMKMYNDEKLNPVLYKNK